MDWTFASDNTIGAHASIVDAIVRVNSGSVHGYGDDPYTEQAVGLIRGLVGEQAQVSFVATGTAANVLGMAHLLKPYDGVICARTSHIFRDESTAPGTFGLTLLTVETEHGKLSPDDIHGFIGSIGNPHSVQPRIVTISQSSELGTVYTAQEIAALATVAHDAGMLLHVDGARIANAMAHLGISLREMVTDTGVDVFTFGFSKNGAMQTEAIVILNPTLGETLDFTVKRGMQYFSKCRFLSAQAEAMLTDDLWLINGGHANSMASHLALGLTERANAIVTHPVQASHVFVRFGPEVVVRLKQHYEFYEWSPGEHRLLCSWKTTEEEVNRFIAIAAGD